MTLEDSKRFAMEPKNTALKHASGLHKTRRLSYGAANSSKDGVERKFALFFITIIAAIILKNQEALP